MLSLARSRQPGTIGRLCNQGEQHEEDHRRGAAVRQRWLAGLGLGMGTAQAFDPQPDPPGKVAPAHRLNPAEIHGFNPQPDPPGLPASAAERG